ncbi:hypothetical protein [uncultured Methylobacterium sp.]|uniref:hypothetical protein n=1 Tax=uncultured Methylobacterium sp. TaxID=157278 RepID=UPI0035CBE7E9
MGLVLASVLLAACAQEGDFGRPKAGAWNSLVETTGPFVARERAEPVSAFPLTDDEQTLRERAWRTLMPTTGREAFTDVIANLTRTRALPRRWRPGDVAAYHEGLVSESFRSPVSRYRRLSEDATADARLITPFAALARRVNEADDLRLRSLPFARTLEDFDVHNAAMRVAENRCLIAWVRLELAERIARYRYALEHLVVEVPGPEAIGPERAIAMLAGRRTLLDPLLPPEAAFRCGLVPGEDLIADLAAGRPLVAKD